MKNRIVWDDDLSDGYSAYEDGNGYSNSDDSYNYGNHSASDNHGGYGDDNTYGDYKDDFYFLYGNDSFTDSYDKSTHRTSGWEKFEDLPAESHSPRKNVSFSLKDVPIFIWFVIAGLIIAASIIVIVMKDSSTISKLNNGIENIAVSIIAYLVYVGIVWLIFYFTFGKRMGWQSRSICLGIICVLVLLCYIIPSLGLLLITLCILLVLLYKIFRS